ncbi:GGDEF domain-containing protein [Aliidiomarina sp. Khilg15.8]
MLLDTDYQSLLEFLPIGLVFQFTATDGSVGAVQINQAAARLLSLDASKLSATREQLNAVRFQLDPELAAGENVFLQQSPINTALAGHYINRRDVLVNDRPLHVQSEELPTENGTWRMLCLQPRDHRLFVQASDSGDILNAEISLRDTLAFDKLISRLSTQLINASFSQVDGHIEHALAALGEFCQADRSYVFEFNDTQDSQSNTHEWVRPGITSHIDELQDIHEQDMPWFFRSMRDEGIFVANDVTKFDEEGSAEREIFLEEDIQSVICIGMYARGKLIGFVGCDMVARQRHWSEADIRRLKLVGEMIANALQNQRYLASLEQTRNKLMQANSQLKLLARQDSLTGLANRRHFDQMLKQEVRRAVRQSLPISLAMIDIDAFKPYNDHFGHIAGDQTLQRVSQLLSDHFQRSGELVSRFGGEEFTVILPARTETEALQDLEQFQQSLASLAIPHPHSSIDTTLTVSIGVVSVHNADSTDNLAAQVLSAADGALYKAKKQGRNRVIAERLS